MTKSYLQALSTRGLLQRRGLVAGTLAALLLHVGALSLPAQDGDSPLKLKMAAEVVKQGEDGAEKRQPAEKAAPGDVLVYTVTCENTGARLLEELRPVIPIPAEVEYLSGSEHPAEAVEASADGVEFASVPLQREAKGSDGSSHKEDVPFSEYRALRWLIKELEPGQKLTVSLRARLKATAGQPEGTPTPQGAPATP